MAQEDKIRKILAEMAVTKKIRAGCPLCTDQLRAICRKLLAVFHGWQARVGQASPELDEK